VSSPSNILILLFRPKNHYEVVYPDNTVKIRAIRFILMIFESGATDNTAQLGLCGGYRLGRVCPTSYAIGLSLRTTVESHTPSKW